MRNEIRKYFVIRNFVMGVCTNNTQPMLQVFRKSVNLDEKKKQQQLIANSVLSSEACR